ncbi:MAG: DUF4240 domain-containing protein [Bacteroides sp.]|nr:DUF4240 domain-containing protein [Bacteroides sp.]
MKFDASKLMTEDKFWHIIEKSEQGRELNDLLSSLSDNELIGFYYWWQYFSDRLYRQDLWAVAYVVKGGCSDDSFDYFRYWLLVQGRKPVYDALENADSLCDLFETMIDVDDEDSLQNEEVNYTVIKAIEDRSDASDEFRAMIENIEIPEGCDEMDFEWEEDDEESIKAICPRTFERYWSNCPIPSEPYHHEEPKTSKGFFAFLKRLFK